MPHAPLVLPRPHKVSDEEERDTLAEEGVTQVFC